MSITKEQAVNADFFHDVVSATSCKKWRRNGQTQTWVRRPEDFRVPIKFGLYTYGQIRAWNNYHIFVADECPVCKGEIK